VVARWVETPYYQHYQHFTDETFSSIAPLSSLTRWRGRIGEGEAWCAIGPSAAPNAEWMLTQTIRAGPGRAGQKSGAIDQNSVKRVAVDTTVMEKNIADPTDSRL
jgi:IS5 family transposase